MSAKSSGSNYSFGVACNPQIGGAANTQEEKASYPQVRSSTRGACNPQARVYYNPVEIINLLN